MHVALLDTGKVLAFGGSGNDPRNEGRPLPAELFDPKTGTITEVGQPLAGDVFCAGHAFLPDGRLLVAGGTRRYDGFLGLPVPPFRGLNQSYLFEPRTGWSRAPNMRRGRWYPTLVALADGRVLAVAGLTSHFPWAFLRKIEAFVPGTGWSKLRHASRWMPLYPRLHLLPDGRVFYSGSYNTHHTFPFSLWWFPTATLDPATGTWRVIGRPRQSEREEGACVLLSLDPPGYRARILLIGGGTPSGKTATNAVESIDMGDSTPRWNEAPPMQFSRYYCYAVLLPDGNVLVLGGRNGKMGHAGMPGPMRGADGEIMHDPLAVLTPELFDVGAGTWTALAPMAVDRQYHSNAILLPDGRVMMAGSNPARGVNELRIEILRPPYLFRGPRPVIDDAPLAVAYGVEFDVETPEADDVDGAALVSPTATTHCVDPGQRCVRLEIRGRATDRLTLAAPTNPNAAPAGPYLLFLLRNGVPSEGRFMTVRSGSAPTS